VLRSIMWGATGSLAKATNMAATVGQVFGWGFIGLGLIQLLSGNFLNGLWTAFIGWFLNSAAEASRRGATLAEHLNGVRVGDVMNPIPQCIDRRASVDDVVREHFIRHGHRAVLVCREDQLAGIVTLTDVKRLAQDKWPQTSVEEIMTRPPLHTLMKDDDLNVALKLLAQSSSHGL